nr:hypothetical protein [Tanacetum cinerariifolium]
MSYAPVPAPSFASKSKNPPTPKKGNPAKDATCHQCGEGNSLVYFCAIPRDDIFETDLSSSNTNDSSMYAISNKRAKLNLDSTLLWHCRLGHINKKRMEKLQHDGLLDSTDIKSFVKCVSCMSRKMARKPYSHQVKRAKDLLGLIHTDVCGPFRTVSRQGARYFVTFTDDFSREYMSRELLDHLKEHGIISHRTPPYTPQFNGVSERGNRTLLDIVRFMMSQTILPKFFWVFSLESVARILNMVSTKKVGYSKETIGYPFYYPPENKVFVARNAEFFENNLIDQEASRSLKDLEIIQEEDTHSSINTSLNHEEDDQEINEPQNDIIPIRTSSRTRCAPDRMCLHVVVEEHGLGDLDIRAIRILIAIAAFYDYEIWKMDVKTAFLDGYLCEEVYMEQPGASGSYVTFLILYVDDILIMGNNIPMLQDVKSYLGRCFTMKDLGEAAYIFRIKIYRDRSKWLIGLCQSSYIKKILKRYFMEHSKRGTILIQEKLKLSKSQGASTPTEKQRMQNIPYASAVGSIVYDVRCTRPDVVFDQNITSDSKRKLRVSCYTDTGYLTDVDDLKSQTGYAFILNGGVVDWKSTKQSIFATSSTCAEYIAAFDASNEAVWIHKFISGLGVVPTIEEPINMYCDNTGAITIMKDYGVTKGARHFRSKVHYLRETIEMGDVRIEKVDTYDNLDDPFSKALAFLSILN